VCGQDLPAVRGEGDVEHQALAGPKDRQRVALEVPDPGGAVLGAGH
jgi:hypothetical protein